MGDLLIFIQGQFLLIAALLVLVYLLIRHETARGGKKLSCSELVRAVNDGSAVVLDVREAKDFSGGHIVDAINISYLKLADGLKALDQHKSKQIIVVDKMGQHSGAAVKTLVANEFDAVRLSGGMAEWQQESLPLVK